MPTFICAVHTELGRPTAFALVEQTAGPDGARYDVRRLHVLSGEDPRREITDALADEPQFVGQTTVVATGGQAAADALHAAGPSVVPVTLVGARSGDADAASVTEQVLVDTFERLYRDGAVDVPGTLDEGSAAVTALYRGADLDAAAPDADYNEDGEVEADDARDGSRPGATPANEGAVAQSGGQASLSTAPVNGREHTEMLGAELDRPLVGRIAATTGATPPDLGEARGVALALALACWYGEFSADNLPVTDKADEALLRQTTGRNPSKGPKTGGTRPAYPGTSAEGSDGAARAQEARRDGKRPESNPAYDERDEQDA